MKLRLASACAVLAVFLVAVPTASAQRRDRTPPSTPTNLRVTGVTQESITVAWNASTDNSGRIQRYVVFYTHGGLYHPGNSTTKTLTSLVPGFSTEIRVQAFDFADNGSALSAPITATTAPDATPPGTPSNLRVTAQTPSSVSLAWDAAAETDPWGFGYNVLLDGQVVTGLGLGTRTVLTARVRRLTPGSTHTFAVRSFDNAGNLSPNSNQVTVTLEASGDRTPPSAPSNLVATRPPRDVCGFTDLRWGASTDNADPASAIEYEIYRNGTLWAVIPAATSTFAYTETSTNTWTVVAVDRAGNASAPSNPSTATAVFEEDRC